MGVFEQVGRNVEAALTRLLDAASDPAKNLDQVLEELRAQLQLGRKELVRGVAAERRLRDAVAKAKSEVEKWGLRAELAVRHGDDELARRALQQKRRLADEQSRLELSHTQQAGIAHSLRTTLASMEQRYRDFHFRQGTLKAKLSQGDENASGFGRANAALREFDRMEEQVDGIDDVLSAAREVDAALGVQSTPNDLELRFALLEQTQNAGESFGSASELDDELTALKHRLRVKL
jgi:phage shock protein A